MIFHLTFKCQPPSTTSNQLPKDLSHPLDLVEKYQLREGEFFNFIFHIKSYCCVFHKLTFKTDFFHSPLSTRRIFSNNRNYPIITERCDGIGISLLSLNWNKKKRGKYFQLKTELSWGRKILAWKKTKSWKKSEILIDDIKLHPSESFYKNFK